MSPRGTVTAATDQTLPEPPSLVPRWVLLFTALLLVWIYTYRISSNPLKWEEPRRCLVAMEMIHRGDYLVPRVMGEIYLSKPPFQNWLVALYSGYDMGRVGALSVRLLTLTALVGICLLLWRLGTPALGRDPDPLPALLFLTTGLTVQFGRVGEIDILFCLLTTAALASFEFGRRRGSAVMQWVAPQALLGIGILTKGIAPVFFYPPVLFCVWLYRRENRVSYAGLVSGAVLMILVVAAWLVPYSLQVPIEVLQTRWIKEIGERAVDPDNPPVLLHLAKYPVRLLGIAMPWSLAVLIAGWGNFRSAGKRIRSDPYLGLCASVVGWVILIFLFVPGVNGRYLFPAIPFFAVLAAEFLRRPPGESTADMGAGRNGGERLIRVGRHPLFWVMLVAILLGVGARGYTAWLAGLGHLIPVAMVLGSLTLGLFAWAIHGRNLRWPVAAPLLLGLIYGVCYAGVFELRSAEVGQKHQESARAIRAAMSEPGAVVLHPLVEKRFACELARIMGRPPLLRYEGAGPFYFISPVESGEDMGGTKVTTDWKHRLYRIEPGGSTGDADG